MLRPRFSRVLSSVSGLMLLGLLTIVRPAAAFTRHHVRALERATVDLPERGCAGVLTSDGWLVATVAHCVPPTGQELAVQLPDGRRVAGLVVHRDGVWDHALVELPWPAPFGALQLAQALPREGDALLFAGRLCRNVQVAEVTGLGRCPSMPRADEAVFTSLAAQRGDSGAPLVDENLRVVALVHGGARCHIATPVAPMGVR